MDIMKKLIGLFFLLGMLLPSLAFPANDMTQTVDSSMSGKYGIVKVRFTCDGVPSNTSITQQTLAIIGGMYLYTVEAWPVASGTAPDAASVMIYDANGLDLLGSEDGGATPYNGLNLIHATLTRITFPNLYIPRAGGHSSYFPLISSILTLDVDNQGAAGADYVVELTFIK
jgi:hypothetical protein